MKNTIKGKTVQRAAGITALIVIMAFAFITCDNGDNPQLKTFTVSFDADNGTTPTSQTITEGGRAAKPTPDPTKEGYDFVYWFNTATDSEWNFDTIISDDISLKAKWVEICEVDHNALYTDETCENGDAGTKTAANIVLGSHSSAIIGSASMREKDTARVEIQNGFDGIPAVLAANIGTITVGGTNGWSFNVGTGKYDFTFAVGVTSSQANTQFDAAEHDLGKCVCPTDAVVLVGEGCSAKYHNVAIEVAGQRVEGIAVTNRDNVAKFTAQILQIEEALEWVVDYSASGQMALIKANIKEIKIVPGPVTAPTINQGVLTVNEGTDAADIFSLLDVATFD